MDTTGFVPTELIGEFIDAAVHDQERPVALLAAHPDLINARWLHGETVLHFLAVEGFIEGVTFLAGHGADVNAVNKVGDSALIDVAVIGETDVADVRIGVRCRSRVGRRARPDSCNAGGARRRSMGAYIALSLAGVATRGRRRPQL